MLIITKKESTSLAVKARWVYLALLFLVVGPWVLTAVVTDPPPKSD